MDEKVYKSPIIAALWSAGLPGFGHIYLGHYLRAFIFMGWEITVNVMSNLNLSILYLWRGELEKSAEVVNYQWLLFYPSVFVFDIWLAYNKAMDINYQLQQDGGPHPPKRTHLTGAFYGFMIGMNFGIFWCFLISPISSGIVAGAVGALVGHVIEKLYIRAKR